MRPVLTRGAALYGEGLVPAMGCTAVRRRKLDILVGPSDERGEAARERCGGLTLACKALES